MAKVKMADENVGTSVEPTSETHVEETSVETKVETKVDKIVVSAEATTVEKQLVLPLKTFNGLYCGEEYQFTKDVATKVPRGYAVMLVRSNWVMIL